MITAFVKIYDISKCFFTNGLFEIFQKEVEELKPYFYAYRLAKDTHMPATRISEIIKGRRKLTADTALRLSQYFGNSADFWLGIQDEYDLRKERERLKVELESIPRAIAS